jgi:hypothetical protein
MHLLIPFAAPLSEVGREALKTLQLPHLAAVLATAGEARRDDGDELSLTPPHERALARVLGLAGADGQLPWAAWRASEQGIPLGTRPWGELTPVHWRVGSDAITLADPEELQLDAAASRALLDAVADLFADEGFTLVWSGPTRWFVAHDRLADLPTASLDRVIGRSVDAWLPPARQTRWWRRLQNEVQMRLHEHPLNQAREARSQPPVNSLWLSGCGVRQQPAAAIPPVIDDRLRRPALAEDWAAWIAAWQALDAGPIAALSGQPATMTLCGERCAAQWSLQTPSMLGKLAARWRRSDPRALLETL